jgi:hypothetical protein
VIVTSLCFAAPALATTTGTTGDFAWSDNGTSVTLTGCATATCPTTLSIPATLDIGGGVIHPVTTIGVVAFSSKTGVTTVTFETPSNVTTIGDYAFPYMPSLATIDIPASVTQIGTGVFDELSVLTAITVAAANQNYKSVDDALLNKAGTTLIKYPVGSTRTSYSIPPGVVSVEPQALYHAWNITSLSLPASATTIGRQAFDNMPALATITVDPANTSLSATGGALYTTTAPSTLIVYPKSSLATTYAVPDGVTIVGASAFADANHLQSVTLPNSVTRIDDYAFKSMDALEAMTFPSGSSLASIGQYAFWVSDKLETFAIPGSVTTIGDGAFGHTHVPSFTIPIGVTRIASMAFYGAHLTSITIPRGVTTIGDSAFYGAMYLEQFNVDPDNPNFSLDSGGVLFNKTKTTLLNYTYGKTATSYTIPDTVTTLGDSAFTGASHLQRVTIPRSVTTMGWGTFYSTGALTRVEFLGDPPACPLCNEYSFWGNHPTVYRYASASNWPNIGSLYFGAPQAYLVVPAISPNTPATPTAVAGDGQVTITVANGTGAGDEPTSYLVTAVGVSPAKVCTVTGAFGNCTITGLTNGTSYTFTATATNTGGTSAASSPSAAVAPQSPRDSSSDRAADNTAATGSGSTPSLTSPSAKVRVISSRASKTAVIATLNVSAPGTVVVTVRGSIASGGRAAKQLSVCKTTKTVTAAATVKVVCPFTKATRSALRSHAINATVTTIFTPTGSAAQTASTQLMLRRR